MGGPVEKSRGPQKGKEDKLDIPEMAKKQRAAAKKAWATWKEERPFMGLLMCTTAKLGSYEALKAAGVIDQNDDLIDPADEARAQSTIARLLIADPEKAAGILGIDPKYTILGRELLRADLNMIETNAVLAILAADHEGKDLDKEPEATKQLENIIPRETIPMLSGAIKEGDVERFREALALVQ